MGSGLQAGQSGKGDSSKTKIDEGGVLWLKVLGEVE
jgi:hypothetical protein